MFAESVSGEHSKKCRLYALETVKGVCAGAVFFWFFCKKEEGLLVFPFRNAGELLQPTIAETSTTLPKPAD